VLEFFKFSWGAGGFASGVKCFLYTSKYKAGLVDTELHS
jgi:hypothetical protein